MFAVADGRELGEPAAGNEQRRCRVPEPERRKPLELAAEIEREVGSPRDDGVDRGHGLEVVLGEHHGGLLGEGFGERVDVLLRNREAGSRTVAAPAPEQAGAGAERGVQVEGGDRPAGSLPVAVGACDEDDWAVVALDEPRGDDPDHALVPVGAGDGVGMPGALLGRPGLDLGHGLAEDPALDGLALPVQLLERGGEPARLRLVLGEEQLERLPRVPEASGSVQAGREPEADGPGVDRRRIDSRALHERAQTGLRGARKGAQPRDGKRSVLVDERDDVGDRRERDEVEMTPRNLGVEAEQGLAQLVDDSGSAELRERVLGRASGDDRTVGQRLARPVMVGDDDVEPAFSRLGDLGDRRDPAVDGEDEPTALLRESGQRLAADAVALVEAARQVPGDLGAELAQEEDGEGGGGDPVHVVVAVDADPPARLHGGADLRARGVHVAEQGGIVRGLLAVEEVACRGRVGVAAADQHAGRQLGDPERADEPGLVVRRAVGECPGAFVHVQPSYGGGRTESASAAGRTGQSNLDRRASVTEPRPTRHR